MAQTGYTPILVYASGTATNVPLAINLTSSALGAELALNYADGKLYYKNSSGTVTLLASAAGSLGDVVGPASATDNALARFDLTTGKLIQNSVGILSDAGILTGLTGITSSGSITFSSLTSGRVPYATTAGLLTDSANLLYSGTDLTVYGLTVGRGAGAVATNTAVGLSALSTNTTGSSNSAFGWQALLNNSTGANNTAVGRNSLRDTTGDSNTAVGYFAAYQNTSGASNTAIGRDALQANTTASNNTAVGYQAGYSNTTGTSLVAIGKGALYGNTTGSDNVAIGESSQLGTTTGIRNVSVGSGTLYANTTGQNNVAIGSPEVAGGYAALRFNTTGSYNTALGSGSLGSNTTASNNTAVGYQAGYTNTTGGNNTNIGYQAGYTNPSSGTNVFVGYQAGYAFNAVGQNSANAFIGYSAGSSVTSGLKNTIIGSYNGNQGGLDMRTINNVVVLSDGDGTLILNAQKDASIALQGAITKAGIGITFPATQSASTDANTLDDYEEGTWTPAGVLSTPGTSSSSSIVATYTKIGRLVTVATNFVFTKGTGTGNFSVSGLPFTVNSALVYTAVALQSESVGLASNVVGAYANPSNTNIIFVVQPQSTSGASTCTDSALAANATIRFSVTYSSAS